MIRRIPPDFDVLRLALEIQRGAVPNPCGGQLRTLASWQHAAGIGYCAALYLKCESKDIEVRWNSTDHVFEGGGII